MLHDRRFGRFLKLSALVAAGVVALSGCGGPGLGKENFARTTVPAAGGSGASDGPITDPAVAPAALRELEPCQFVDQAAMAQLGQPKGDPIASTVNFDACRATATDPGGKTVKASVEIGGIVMSAADKTTGAVQGIPQVELPDVGSSAGCVVSALTQRTPDLGVTFRVDYDGGDACAAGRKLVATAVQKLHSSPKKLTLGQGSLVAVDPCTAMDPAALDPVVKDAKALPVGFHTCSWGLIPGVRLAFDQGVEPSEGDGWLKADAGTPNQAYSKAGTSGGSSCKVTWQHRQWKDDRVELVLVEYDNQDGDPQKDDPCGKTVALAKSVAAKLPAAS